MADPIIVGGVPAKGFAGGELSWSSGRVGPYYTPGGSVVVFAFSSFNEDAAGIPDGSPSIIAAYTSADNGVTWAVADAINSKQAYRADFTGPTGDPATYWSQPYRVFDSVKHPVNNEVFVVFFGLACNIVVARFDLTTETWTGEWNSAVTGRAQSLLLGASDSLTPVCEFETTTEQLVICYQTSDIVDPLTPQATRCLRFDTLLLAFGADYQLLTDVVFTPGFGSGWDYCAGLIRGTNGRVHAILWGSSTGEWNLVNHDEATLHVLAADGLGGGGGPRQVVAMSPMTVLPVPAMTSYGTEICVVLADRTAPMPPAPNEVIYSAESADVPVWAVTSPPSGIMSFLGDSSIGLDSSSSNIMWLYEPEPGGGANDLLCSVYDGATITAGASLVAAAEGPFQQTWCAPYVIGAGFGVVYSKFIPGPATAPPLFYSLFGAPPPPPPPPPGVPSSSSGAGGFGGGGGFALGPGGFAAMLPGALVVGKNYIPTLNRFDKMLRKMCECYQELDWMAMQCPWAGLWDGASMPNGAVEYLERGAIVTPGPGVDNLVLQCDVPIGYESMLYGLVLQYTGTGFVEGSGDIIWRVQVGTRWLKGYGNSLFSRGTERQPFHLADYARVNSGSRMRVFVNVPNLSGLIEVGKSFITCALQGWHYPA